MKILISGATGFIGKHLVKRLKKEHHIVCAIVRPSTDLDWLKKTGIKFYVFNDNIDNLISFMQKEKFDGIIHLASLFLAQHESKSIKALIDSDILFGTALLEASVRSGVSWFINTGTFWQHYKNKEYSPVNLYAATKQAFEDIARYYMEVFPINFVTVKLNDTFGPDDTRAKVFNLWMKISKSGEALDMSAGKQIIDISYIDNVIDGYARMTTLLSQDKNKKLKGQSFTTSSGRRMTLKKLAKIFGKVTGTKLNINWGRKEYRLREVMIPWTKGKNIPGWKPKISIEEGIKKTFEKQQ